MEKLLQEYRNKLRELRYSPSTQEIYPQAFRQFLLYFKGRHYPDITKKEIESYLLYLVDERKVGFSTQNTAINAIKFYYEIMLRQPRKTYYINRPRKEYKNPILLTDEEVQALLNSCTNRKHKCVIGLLYGCGLRISEVINLKVVDIDSKLMVIRVRGGKGNKDRDVKLPDKLLIRLREYVKEFKPADFLFTGQSGAPQYSEESIRNLLRTYARKAGIKKKVNPHLLRHQFATEHIENDTTTLKLQQLMGHGSPKTTSRYHHLRRDKFKDISSPIDNKNF